MHYCLSHAVAEGGGACRAHVALPVNRLNAAVFRAKRFELQYLYSANFSILTTVADLPSEQCRRSRRFGHFDGGQCEWFAETEPTLCSP